MRTTSSLLALLWLAFATPGYAADLSAQLTQFFQARDPQHAAGMTVVVRTPQTQWPACDTPQLLLPGNSRQWGNLSIAASCGQNRRYLQVQVQVTGGIWWPIVSWRVAATSAPVTSAGEWPAGYAAGARCSAAAIWRTPLPCVTLRQPAGDGHHAPAVAGESRSECDGNCQRQRL